MVCIAIAIYWLNAQMLSWHRGKSCILYISIYLLWLLNSSCDQYSDKNMMPKYGSSTIYDEYYGGFL